MDVWMFEPVNNLATLLSMSETFQTGALTLSPGDSDGAKAKIYLFGAPDDGSATRPRAIVGINEGMAIESASVDGWTQTGNLWMEIELPTPKEPDDLVADWNGAAAWFAPIIGGIINDMATLTKGGLGLLNVTKFELLRLTSAVPELNKGANYWYADFNVHILGC